MTSRKKMLCLLVIASVVLGCVFLFFHSSDPVRTHLAAIRHADHHLLKSLGEYANYRTWLWLLRGMPEREEHENALVKMGYLEKRVFTFGYQTMTESTLHDLFEIFYQNPGRGERMDDMLSVSFEIGGVSKLEITTSTNQMRRWEQAIQKFDRPPGIERPEYR